LTSYQYKAMRWRPVQVRALDGEEESYQRALANKHRRLNPVNRRLFVTMAALEAVRSYHLGDRKDTRKWAARTGEEAMDYLSGDWLDHAEEVEGRPGREMVDWAKAFSCALPWLAVLGEHEVAARVALHPAERSGWLAPERDAHTGWWFVYACSLRDPDADGLLGLGEAIERCGGVIRSTSRATAHPNSREAFEAFLAVLDGRDDASKVFNAALKRFVKSCNRKNIESVLPLELTVVRSTAARLGRPLDVDPEPGQWLVDLDGI